MLRRSTAGRLKGILLLLSMGAGMPGCTGWGWGDQSPPGLRFGDPQRLLLEPDLGPFQLTADRSGLTLLLGNPSNPPFDLEVRKSPGHGFDFRPFLSAGGLLASTYHSSAGDVHWVRRDGTGLLHGLGPGEDRSSEIDRPISERAGNWTLQCTAGDEMAVAWIDRSQGRPQILFSRSGDHGSSWTLPHPVNTGSRGGEIMDVVLHFQDQQWNAVWSENRHPQTLFDLYLARSRDGIRWSEALRLNDDQEHAWNWKPSLAGWGSRLFILFADYRERDALETADENIYFTQVGGRAEQAAANIRVNDGTRAIQSYPALALDSATQVLAAVWTDQRQRLSRDIYASISADQGRSWSPNQRVNSNPEPVWIARPLAAADGGGRFYVGWIESRDGRAEFCLRQGEVDTRGPAPADSEQETPRPGPLVGLSDSTAQLLESADFDTGDWGRFQPRAGNWVIREGAALGFGSHLTFLEWSGEALSDFVLEGRFRLDPQRHYNAYLFFRLQEIDDTGPLNGYQIINHFRQGIFLTRSEVGFQLFMFHAQPITDLWFPFRQNQWYSFRLVVEGDRLDYFIDGQWMLSQSDLAERAPGRLGVGSNGYPTEFDSLRIYSLGSASSLSNSTSSKGLVRK